MPRGGKRPGAGAPRKGRKRHEITEDAARALMDVAAARLGRTATAEEESAVLSALVMEAKMSQYDYEQRQRRREEVATEAGGLDDTALIAEGAALIARDWDLCERGYKGLIDDPEWRGYMQALDARGLRDKAMAAARSL